MHLRSTRQTSSFNAIAISVASPDDIELWSHGEVTKPETINYRTQRAEMDGLFCERIFGPTRNWECFCGKYKRVRYAGVVCEKCGVEVTRSIVRRDRMGHIDLAVPVVHIWFLRSTPSRIGLLLDLPVKTIEQVVYFAAYIITEIDEEAKTEAENQLAEEFNTYKKKAVSEYEEKLAALSAKKLSKEDRSKQSEKIEKDHAKKLDELKKSHEEAKKDLDLLNVGHVLTELEYREMNMKFGHVFRAGTGAESIQEIISRIDLQKMLEILLEDRKKASGQKQKKLVKRIRLLGSLLKANIRPEWMIMTKLPVIPPDLRPMVQLDGGRFAASDLNDLYRRVINRNNRLKKLIGIGAPEVICRNEKRMLQEAVDTLLNNSARSGKAVYTAGDRRKLRSLSDMLKGKQGRFRQNLLGKRVDYSGRSVIVVGPQLKLHQCGLPKEMALKLFKPFVIGELIRQEHTHNVKGAERMIQTNKREVWDILEKVTQGRYVLLNRAPTLHRLGIQAFQPVLIEGKAIQIHPLVCSAFNADFDGDQMAVHLPLSAAAQKESREYMVSTKNLLKPSAGDPIITPTQDMVLGCYFLTQIHEEKKLGVGMVFASESEAINAYRMGYADIQAKIKARVDGKVIETSIGRLIFNSFIPKELGYINRAVNSGALSDIIAESYELCGEETTAELADNLKRIGFKFATKSGVSISAYDINIPQDKTTIVDKANEVVQKIVDHYNRGLLSEDERYTHTIKVWAKAKSDITTIMIDKFKKDTLNNIYYMIDSGARGNWGQITQLCGMKGLVANPGGRTIELPIKSNLKEGFSILEYFIATHGGRKGKSDTALKTAEAGYLTRRLVDAVQDIIIREEDCGSKAQNIISREESDTLGVSYEERIFGRTINAPIKKGKKVLAEVGAEIDNDLLELIQKEKIDEVCVRSILSCETENGICQKCYGRDLATNRKVKIGTPVGIIAAQSIGEPGTQLTMRTFHMGGVAEGADITQGLTRVEELFEARPPKTPCTLSEVSGKVTSIEHISKGGGIHVHIVSDGKSSEDYGIPPSYEVVVKKGDTITEKMVLAKSTIDKETIKARVSGTVEAIEADKVILRHKADQERTYHLGVYDSIKVDEGDTVKVGQQLNAGHYNLQELMAISDASKVQKYVMSDVQEIYASQGQSINDKHIEIIVKKMLSKVRVIDAGDTELLPGEITDIIKFNRINKAVKAEGKQVAFGERLLLGLTRVSLLTESWLAAASFQETIRVLVEAAVTKRVDNLKGLKENVIIGKLIQAGEIYKRFYQNKMRKLEAMNKNGA